MRILLGLAGFCYGILSSAGVFTVLIAVGLIPRFAGRTHTADKILLYEETVIWGTICGAAVSLFPEIWDRGGMPGVQSGVKFPGELPEIMFQIVYGLFSGIFVGCLALAIAEMLDSIPIFARRINFKRGVGIATLGIAFGKLLGALLYFGYGF